MSEMSARVKVALQAEALWLALALGKDWRFRDSSFEALARAAMKAMRDPTETMAEAGIDHIAIRYPTEQQAKGGLKLAFNAMIDEALR